MIDLSKIEALEAAAERATPGPWRWELNLKSKCVALVSLGRGRMLETVMDFVRWGMGGATPRFRTEFSVMQTAEATAAPIAGREHHSNWHQTVTHPDAAHLANCDPDTIRELCAAWRELERMKAAAFVHKRECNYWRVGQRHAPCSCSHACLFEAKPGMYDTSERFCVTCGRAESTPIQEPRP